MKTRHYALVMLLGALALIPVGVFYTGQIRYAYQLADAHHLPYSYANALQHSHAAAASYRGLRHILNPDSAEWTIINLGILNEYFERVFKRHDTTLEMMKDLHNNQTGVSVARWREGVPSAPEPAVLLVELARNRTLIVAENDVPLGGDQKTIAAHSADVDMAKTWFVKVRYKIRKQVLTRLEEL